MDVFEFLSCFNNRTFTKKQWDIILKGCGCPKSAHFWAALVKNNMTVYKQRHYTLVDMDAESYQKVYDEYATMNRNAVRKCYDKKRRAAKAKRTVRPMKFFVNPDGTVTLVSEKEWNV